MTLNPSGKLGEGIESGLMSASERQKQSVFVVGLRSGFSVQSSRLGRPWFSRLVREVGVR